MPDSVIGVERVRVAGPDDPPAFDNGVVVGKRDQLFDVFVDDQHALAFAAQLAEAGPDLVADERREALGRFVEDEQARIGD